MKLSELQAALKQALNLFYKNDDILLSKNASEWAIAHRLAVYLEHLISGWHVDCEYNRQGEGEDTKTNPANKIVRPDIILHHRERLTIDHNLLVIEMKKKKEDSDSGKVQDYTSAPKDKRKFQYQYGLTLSFVPELEETWYANGCALRDPDKS